MTWLVVILGAFADAMLAGAAGGVLGYQWGKSDGRQEEKLHRAEQDLRLSEDRRKRAAEHERQREPWYAGIINPEPQPFTAVPPPRPARRTATQPNALITNAPTVTDLPALRDGDQAAPRFIPAPTEVPVNIA